MKDQIPEPNIQANQLKQKIIQNQEKLNIPNKIYDDEFVSLINGLNESIKEYYKVSRNNISEANSLLAYYKEQGELLQSLMSETNQNSMERDNEIMEHIPKINEFIEQFQLNTNSNDKNLNLFFEDAKILFKKMKMKRQQKLLEIKNFNNYKTNDNNEVNKCAHGLNDSFSNSFNVSQSKNIATNNLINKNNMNNIKRAQSPFRRITPNMNNPKVNPNSSPILISIKNIYMRILKLLNNFSEFTFIISKTNYEASNKYINLQTNIKKELNILINFVKNNILTKNKNKVINFNDINSEQSENKRSQSKPNGVNREIEKLKIINQNNEQKIMELNNQLNMYINNMGNSNNKNINLNNILKQREYQIRNLQQQLNVYQNNENSLNNQISELNTKFNIKINQYELQISNKDKNIMKFKNENTILKNKITQLEIQIRELSQNYNGLNMNNNMENDINNDLQNQIETLKREMQIKENEFNKEKEMIMNKNALSDQQINTINAQNQKIIEDLKMKINQLNKEIINYQKKEKLNEENNNNYIKQIEDMNNNIVYTNKIIEQKDEIIKQLNQKKNDQIPDINNINNSNKIDLVLKKERDDYKFQFEQMQKKYLNTKELLEEKNANAQQQNNNNNNDMLKMKLMDMQLENENLKKEITELKINNNNNLILNNQIINGNNIQPNNSQNNEYIKKINELTLENQKYKELSSGDKEKITKLETDINKKNEELDGLKTFIFKLQSQLEKNDDNINRNKQKNFENEILNTDPNRNKKNKNYIEQNKSFDGQEGNTMKNLLNKLNDRETTISTLQKRVKELQFQLEEKQVEKEISGFRTEDCNFSNYEEEFDLKKMVNGARDKNRSEDINIDYPGIQGIKDKYKELLQNMNLLEEQVKILICNINCNSKIKPQITQICQLMRIPAKNIQLIIAGKDKKKALGIVN